MIKISMNNEKKIKDKHVKYFDTVVKKKFNEIQKYCINKDIKGFFDFFTNENWNRICIGNLSDLDEVINQINKSYNEKKEIRMIDENECKEIEEIIDKYKKSIDGDKKSCNKKQRYEEWIVLLENIKSVSSKNLNLDMFAYNEEAFSNKSKIKEKIKSLKKMFTKKTLKELLNDIFNYDSFSKDGDWDRHKIISMMGISVCPYCNRQYISNYNNKTQKTTADLDHFYCKTNYPYLALSLYNFIPSCSICNSRFKNKKDFYMDKHIYPFDQNYHSDNMIFETKFKTGEDKIDINYLLGESSEFDIDIIINDKNYESKIKNSIETFKLRELYSAHKNYIREIIFKANVYNKTNTIELKNIEGLFKDENEIKNLIFGSCLDGEDLDKRPLSKLTRDICKEFGIM